MSADNRICILQDSSGRWFVWMGSLSSVYHSPPHNDDCLGYATLEQAFAAAHKMADECTVLEGGVEQVCAAEQAEALKYEIDELTTRLQRLEATGSQWAPPWQPEITTAGTETLKLGKIPSFGVGSTNLLPCTPEELRAAVLKHCKTSHDQLEQLKQDD